MPYTTQQLIQILDQEMQASWRGDRLLLSAGERFNDPVLSLALGSEKISKVYAYREFREQVHDYQHREQVSGLIWRECRFRDHTLSYPELHNQLTAIPADKQELRAAKAAVLDFWRATATELSLWLVADEPQVMNRETIEQLAHDAEWAEVDATRQELYLGLCWGKPQECHYRWALPESGCRRFVAAERYPQNIKV
ncbi:MAG: hypothetical protein HC838_13565 [Spirulinaceae cyanobacterium RM2_2_10]|nr:hypothetical protein [Spirulinaceae cyanobacterium SM2_1_0]NJO20853.1 hypothetical protein [Spirulinaceae cyanobacterium RM2_2_10]